MLKMWLLYIDCIWAPFYSLYTYKWIMKQQASHCIDSNFISHTNIKRPLIFYSFIYSCEHGHLDTSYYDDSNLWYVWTICENAILYVNAELCCSMKSTGKVIFLSKYFACTAKSTAKVILLSEYFAYTMKSTTKVNFLSKFFAYTVKSRSKFFSSGQLT